MAIRTIKATVPWDGKQVEASTGRFVDIPFYTADWELPEGYGWACIIRGIHVETTSANFGIHIYRKVSEVPQREYLVYSSDGHMEWLEETPNVFYADHKGDKVIHIYFENDGEQPASFDIQIDYEPRALHQVCSANRADLSPGVYGTALYGTSVYGKE